MKLPYFAIALITLFAFPHIVFCQNTEKVIYDEKDSTNGYYLAMPPRSGNIQGVQVLFLSFNTPEYILPETRLPSVGSANDILTIIASLDTALCADDAPVARISKILNHVVKRFSADTAKFALGGYEYAGNIVLRYTELCYEHPEEFSVRPKAVFAIDCPVDLVELMHWCEREIKKNYFDGNVGDAKYISNALTRELGDLSSNKEKYIRVSPFYKDAQRAGYEQWLKDVPVRLYYDTDIRWELKNRRNSYYDTYIPDGSELINRLLLAGNKNAEFISSKLPGMRSNGLRNPHSWSIVDETDCIQWLKQKLDIFDPGTYSPAYYLSLPKGWGVEQFRLPPDFARELPYKGIQDVRFAPGWGDVKSEEYWAYAYLLWLEAKPVINAQALQENLKAYFGGLVARNIPRRKIPADKLVPTVTAIRKIKTSAGDTETFRGTVSMLDYMTQTPMILNTLIHEKKSAETDHTALFLEFSPKPVSHPIWTELDKLWKDFRLKK